MRSASSISFGTVGLLVAAVLTAIVFGLGASTGSLQIYMLMIGALFVPVVLTVPPSWLVAIQLVLVTVVAGSLEYFAQLHQANWLPTLIFMALLLRACAEPFARSGQIDKRPFGISPLLALLLIFCGIFIASVVLNAAPPMQSLVGLRHYLFPLSLTALIAVAAIPDRFWVNAWRWSPWLLIAQFPVCLYQSFFVARSREQAFGAVGISWDAVVGTFGGNAEAGGASGALALFLCAGIATVTGLRRAGVISNRLMLVSVLSAIGSILLAEVKVVAVFLPLALLILNRQAVLKSGFKAIVWLAGSFLFVIVLLIAYNFIFWQGKTTKGFDLSETVDYVLKAEADPRFVNRMTGEVSRYGAILKWADENIARGDASTAVLGHGPAASKVSSLFGYGSAARKYPFQLTTSTISTVLWDLGVLGLAVFLAAIFLAFKRVCGEANGLRAERPAIAAVLDSLAVTLGLVLVGTAYNADALNHPAVQTVLALTVGVAFRKWHSAPHRLSSRDRGAALRNAVS